MTHKEDRAAVTSLKVMREQRWVYEQRQARRSWHDVYALCARPVDEGGLGYVLGIGTLRALHRTYVAEAIEVEERTREEYVHAEVADLDRQAAALHAMIAQHSRHAARLDTDVDMAKVAGVLKELRMIGESRRRLLGLDAPTRVDTTVTVERDLDAELRALLDDGTDERIDHA